MQYICPTNYVFTLITDPKGRSNKIFIGMPIIPLFVITARIAFLILIYRVYKKKLNKFEIALNFAKRL